jgi:hypothetical protein
LLEEISSSEGFSSPRKKGINMAEPKTKPTGEDIDQFLSGIEDPQKRKDSLILVEMMRQITNTEPKIWASSMVGFGDHHYRYTSGREGDVFVIGFAPRKQDLTLYGLLGSDQQEPLLKKLGKYKAGKGCLYVRRLEDIDLPTLHTLLQQAYEHKMKDIT